MIFFYKNVSLLHGLLCIASAFTVDCIVLYCITGTVDCEYFHCGLYCLVWTRPRPPPCWTWRRPRATPRWASTRPRPCQTPYWAWTRPRLPHVGLDATVSSLTLGLAVSPPTPTLGLDGTTSNSI